MTTDPHLPLYAIQLFNSDLEVRWSNALNRLLTTFVFTLSQIFFVVAAHSDQLDGIKEFDNGDPALADEVNANNLILSNKAQDLEARIKLLEDTSDRLVRITPGPSGRVASDAMRLSSSNQAEEGELVELLGGKLILEDVDCRTDPYALNRLYVDNSQYSYIQFTIIGDCYGDISRTTLGEAAPEGTYPYIQEHAQVISIYPGEDPDNPGNPASARIIPNVDSGWTSLYASFGGALYINGVDIVVGDDYTGVLFSRGSTGDLHDVTITLNTDYQTGVRVQHAANPYLGNVTIQGNPEAAAARGLFLLNNAATYLYGDLSLSGARQGIVAIAGSSLFSWGRPADVQTPSSSDYAFWVDSAHIGLGSVTTNGSIWVREGGDASLGELTFSGDEIRVDNDGFISMVPKKADGAVMDNADLNAILNCNGLATAAIMDSTATDGSANEIANTECFNTSQWEDFVNSVLSGGG